MKELMKRISIPEEARDEVCAIYDRIKADTALYGDMVNAVNEYFEKQKDYPIEEYIKGLAQKLSENHYTVYLVFLMECVVRSKVRYDAKGVPEQVYWDTMTDISYKVAECKKIHGVYGVDVFAWFHGIFAPYIFKLGRLEYAIGELVYDSYKDYAVKGDTVYNMHIPSAGPLTYELFMDSLKKAYDFYKPEKYLIVHCGSWLIYPPFYREVFIDGSNMKMFYEQFDMLDEVTTGKTGVYRWVFNATEDTPDSELPQDTRLQKNMLKYLSTGKSSGAGKGIIVFDGEKIVNK